MIRTILTATALLTAFTVFIIPAYLGPDDLKKCDKPQVGTCAPADAIVAVSGGDTIARVDEAIRLFRQGWGDHLIFSGAAADKTGPSNALAMKKYATEMGIPATQISIEEFSNTTAENAVNTSLFIQKNSIKKIILVTSAYHQRRASLEFSSRLGDKVEIVNHPVARDRQWTQYWWLSFSGLWLAYGELVKIILFYLSLGTVL